MNDHIYSKSYEITDHMTDRFGRMKPSSLLLCIQEVSGLHSTALGVSKDCLADKNLFWAILRSRVEILRLPRAGERIRLQTWPLPTTRVAYPRAVAAFDESGSEVFRAITIWVLMDSATRAMVLPGKSGVQVNGLLLGSELAVPTGLPARVMEQQRQRQVCFTDLDGNGHMNNTRYLDWVWDLLPSDFHLQYTPKELTLCYLNEAREGQQLQLQWELLQEGCLQVDIHRPSTEDRVFSARIRF